MPSPNFRIPESNIIPPGSDRVPVLTDAVLKSVIPQFDTLMQNVALSKLTRIQQESVLARLLGLESMSKTREMATRISLLRLRIEALLGPSEDI